MLLLERMTSGEIANYLKMNDRILFPIGSIEQHGPKGVLGTDFMIAEKLAHAIAGATSTVCAPSVPYGMSEHHSGFTGTISIGAVTLINFYAALLSSIYRSGFRRIMIVNGHGGNTPCIKAACSEAADSCPDILVRIAEWFVLPTAKEMINDAFGDEDGLHAMPSELSQIEYLYDGLVGQGDQERQEKHELDVFLTRAVLEQKFPDGSINSNQNLSNREFGNKLFNECVRTFAKEMMDWRPLI